MRVLEALNVKWKYLNWRREINWFQKKAMGKTLLAKMRRTALLATVYVIWKTRNSLIF